MRTSDVVQRRQIARRELALENALAKLDKYHLLILDDIVYVSKDQAETSVLFELIGSCYERRSMLITANQPFGEWARSSQTKGDVGAGPIHSRTSSRHRSPRPSPIFYRVWKKGITQPSSR